MQPVPNAIPSSALRLFGWKPLQLDNLSSVFGRWRGIGEIK
jgi:hypothetical protein